jgi:hypothetical protein
LNRAIEWARRSILGLPVLAPHACNTGAASAKPTKISAKNMWMSMDPPVIKRAPPTLLKFSATFIWARRCRPDRITSPTL